MDEHTNAWKHDVDALLEYIDALADEAYAVSIFVDVDPWAESRKLFEALPEHLRARLLEMDHARARRGRNER